MSDFQPFSHVEQNTTLWMAVRRYFGDLSASDLAAVIGAHPHRSPVSVAREKRGYQQKEPVEEVKSQYLQRLLEHGHRMEPLIAGAVAHLFVEGSVHATGIWQREIAGHHIVTASPDRFAQEKGTGKKVLIECKASAPLTEDDLAGEEAEEATLKFYDVPQLLAQMYCTASDTCYYARHNGHDSISVYRCAWDPVLWRKMEAMARTFMDLFERNQVPARLQAGIKSQWKAELEAYMARATSRVCVVPLPLH
jgi:hypothetical protein